MTRLNLSLFASAGLSALLSAQVSLAAAADRGPAKTSDAASSALTVERVSSEPDAPTDVAHAIDPMHWSPDGARVAWMQLLRPLAKAPDPTPQQEIWTFAPNSPASSGQPESAPLAAAPGQPILLVPAARVTASLSGTDAPRHRRLDDDDSGANPFLMRDFAWSPDHGSLLLIGAQSIAWLDLASGKSKLLVSGDEPLADAALSPDGRTVSFIRNHSLCLVPVASGPARTLIPSQKPGLLEGELDWPYRNEFHLSRGFAWSPDSSAIAYLEIDDRQVARYTMRASNGDTREIVFPKAGGELPIVRVWVKSLKESSPPVQIQLGITQGLYVPRFAWLPDSRHLAVERLDRRQQTLDLLLGDTATGKTRTLLTEKDQYWINLSDSPYFLQDGKRFLWSSERTGFRHLYLYDIQGKELVQLTHGEWEVTALCAVDESKGRIYFTATETSPLERHLYQVNLDGSGMTRITHAAGTHQASVAPNAAAFVDTYSNRTTPPRPALVSLPASDTPVEQPHPGTQTSAAPKTDTLPPLQPIEFLTLKLHLGAEAHAFLIKPPAFDPAKKYPVIVYLAGGPGEQLVRDAWGGAAGLWMQLMAQKGYVIFALDNQATAARGHYFEEPIHLRLGAQELTDQRDGLIYLSSLPWVDTARLGVCGWGYGGYLAVHAMLDRPVAFKAGFAGAPVIDWHFFDAIFAERYLDDPVAHADGWDASTALENESPKFFKGSLLVAQGTDDEFVHMENVLTLQDRLLDVGKSADLLLFPDRGHQIEDPGSRRVLFSHMTDFFVKNL